MKHLHLSFLLTVLMSMVGAKTLAIGTNSPSGVILNSTNFPDATFRAYISELTGVAENNTITEESLLQVAEINVSNKGIGTLKGIEHFTELEVLHCANNHLTSLDVSMNTALTWLDCMTNLLNNLDLSKNIFLVTLWCDGNLLTNLDVSNYWCPLKVKLAAITCPQCR